MRCNVDTYVIKENIIEKLCEISDEALVEKVKNGDHDASNEIAKRYELLIFKIAREKGLSQENAEEVLYDVLYKVVSKIDKFDSSKSSLKNWVCTITKNTTIDRWRKCERESHLESTFGADFWKQQSTVVQHFNNEQNQRNQDSLAYLNKLLEIISPRDRQILIMKTDGKSHEEIAEMLEMKVNAVKTAYSRGLKKLQENAAALDFPVPANTSEVE